MNKTATIISTILGIMLINFGLNIFLRFMPTGELTAPAGEFMGALVKAGYIMPLVALVEIITGFSILLGIYRALSLIILFPIALNALLFHLFLDLGNTFFALLLVAMNLYLMFAYKEKYDSILKA